MEIKIVEINGVRVAVCASDDVVLADGQSALEFAANIFYGYSSQNIAINKAAVTEEFFNLSTGIAGEIAQKFANYRYRVAIIGDFSGYSSKSLRDYIYECNNGNCLFFVSGEAEALEKLATQR